MTPTVQTLLIVFVAAPAAGAALVAGIRAARARRLRHLDRWLRAGGRESESEPASPVPPTTETGTLLLPVVPVPHVGATADWSPLRTIGTKTVAAELVTPVEQVVADHAELDPITEALATFNERVWNAIEGFLGAYPDVALKVRAAVDQTGELFRTEDLYAWLVNGAPTLVGAR